MVRGNSGYQTGYVFNFENPVHCERKLRVTSEHDHGNHMANGMSSTSCWYAEPPTQVVYVPPVLKRVPERHDNSMTWPKDSERECPGKPVVLTEKIKIMKTKSGRK